MASNALPISCSSFKVFVRLSCTCLGNVETRLNSFSLNPTSSPFEITNALTSLN